MKPAITRQDVYKLDYHSERRKDGRTSAYAKSEVEGTGAVTAECVLLLVRFGISDPTQTETIIEDFLIFIL